ncbi:MAG: DNA translocase FtsK 4TM domain-containing protein [Bacilli bacterium]|nr:DNA translocase FtsK 4TM domain-containing protein [Bacilli bacterium]
MAKRKQKRSSTTKSFGHSAELTGLILILLGIIGFGFGPVGTFLKKFCMFLTGEWYFIVLFGLLYFGVYMVIKRKFPKYYKPRLIGIYIIVMVILVASHFEFINTSLRFKEIIKLTWHEYVARIHTVNSMGGVFDTGSTNIIIGGGMIGALLAGLMAQLLGKVGTIITLVVLGIFGIILLFDITIADIFEKIKNFFFNKDGESDEDDDKASLSRSKRDKEVIITNSDEPEDHKIVITSMDDIKEGKPVSEKTEAIEVMQNSNYRLPSMDLLDDPVKNRKTATEEEIHRNREALEKVLGDFQIKGTVVEIHVGPSVTQYEVSIPAGTKVSRIVSINKEIALALAATDVRIQAPIPGKSTIGVELPNKNVSPVKIKEILGNIPSKDMDSKLLVSLGKDIMGRVKTADISKMPHLLVAGSTGSGKSVCINSIIASILMRYRPDEVKLVLVDPKKVELSNYNGVPHLLCPVVNDPKKANATLQKIVAEMDKRYDIFSDNNVKNISGYNEYVEKENKKPHDMPLKKMPYIVVIIDELADLMLVASKEVEDSIMRITQMARAAGIHLIVATQRPSTDVITGVVKANIPSRISFAVSSQIDSRTILDMAGAEKLLGRGDMLYLPMGENVPIRIQGCYISDSEIERLIKYVCNEQKAQYNEEFANVSSSTPQSGGGGMADGADDPLYDEIVEFAVSTGKISASLIQRRFRLGYNRAARLVDLLEERGIIGPQNGSKPREVLVKLDNKEQ